MAETLQRKDRLHELLDLARVYRGWTQTDLARALNRDRSRLYADIDNPKLDMIVALADVLEWPVDSVVEFLWAGLAPPADASRLPGTFEELDETALKSLMDGDYSTTLRLARQLHELAETPEQRAHAYRRECAAWDALGRYTKALFTIQQALRQPGLPTDLRHVLQVNLANAYYTLNDLQPAFGLSQALVNWFDQHPPTARRCRVTQAFAYYVRGSVYRQLMSAEPESVVRYAYHAREDLRTARGLHEVLASEFSRDDLAGVGHTCAGALIEVEAELGERAPDAAIEALLDGLNAITDVTNEPRGDWLESYGWWCVFGGSLAMRHLNGQRLQFVSDVFAEKLLEIGDQLNNWAFRERALTLRYQTNQILSQRSGLKLDLTIDDQDVRLIAGAMGRFPAFRGLGWEILRTSKVIRDAVRR